MFLKILLHPPKLFPYSNPTMIHPSFLFIGLTLTAILAAPLRAGEAANLLVGLEPVVTHTKAEPLGKFSAIQPGVWRLDPPTRTEKGGNGMRVAWTVPAPLPAGGGLVFECELRAVSNPEASSAGQSGLLLDALAPGTDPSKSPSLFRHILLAGPDWETFRIPIANEAAAAADWQLALSPAHFDQAVELRDIRLRALRPGESLAPAASYPGQEPDAAWRKTARERIAENRMGDLTVRVVDRFGKPVPSARVTLEQTRHAYRFGTCVVASRITDADITFRDPAMTREQFLRDNIRYREELLRLFNYAVFENDLKWPMWDGSKPNFSQSATFRALEWLREHNIPVKGHTLIWASWKQTPKWLKALDGDKAALQAAILRHIRDIATATGPFTSFWDVLNEPMSHRDILELLGHEAVAEWFRTAREFLPGQKLLLNDFDIVGNGGNPTRREGIIALVRDLKKYDGAPDILGFQSHFWSNRFTPPEKLWKILDEMHAATGLPLAATEFDINFPNDQVQADYTRDFLTAWFAHPATESFIMWGFWGGAHWFGERGAMFCKDWSPKPNLAAYTDLVFKEWWTKTDGATLSNGKWSVRGFKGDYQLRIEADGFQPTLRTSTISDQPASLEVVLHPAVK